MRGRGSQRGQAIVLIALMMAVLVGFVALAIDSARAFDGRRIMQDAVDNAALAAAEYYQNNPGGWSSAEAAAGATFAADNRVYTSRSCSPGSVAPAPGAPGTPLSMTCTFGTTSYQLTIAAEDDGPGGQSFLVTGQRSLDVALMQVLGQSSTLTVKATGQATATDEARSPVLAGLSSSGCYGVGGTVPLNISSTTNPITIVGDVVANGTFNVGTNSFPRIAGNVLTRCAAPNNGSTNISYYCWPGTAPTTPGATATPCTNPAVAGRLLTTAGHFADPGYSPPPAPSNSQPTPGSNVVLSPGVYAADPQFGSTSPYCYFLSGGVYEWQSGMTVNLGIVSNELKPPDEPDLTDATDKTVSAHQFWNDNGATCAGSFAVSANAGGAGASIANGTWSVVVTAVRITAYNGIYYERESAPSACRQATISGNQGLTVSINNVPGAGGYNVYAAPPGSGCAAPPCTSAGVPAGCQAFGLVAANAVTGGEDSINYTGTQTQGALGSVSAGFDGTLYLPPSWAPDANAAADTAHAYPPAAETSPWSAGLPNQNPARGTTATGGDRANQNHCVTVAGAGAPCPSAVTPGAVAMYLVNNTCFNVKSNLLPASVGGQGGDVYLFGGYQYDWILFYEPPATTCSNTWRGFVASAPIGLIYTPGAAVQVAGPAGFSSYSGGVIASTILIQAASGLVIDFNRNYAPAPGGTALTG